MLVYSSHQIYRDRLNSGVVGGYFTFGGTDVYAISNNHVMANINSCQPGDPIYITGTQVRFGLLQNWVILNTGNNYLDAALAKLDPANTPGWRLQQGSSQPAGYRQAATGARVYMVLPNGLLSWGTISNAVISEPVTFNLLGQDFPFSSLVEITGDDGPFSTPGDSGGIVFSDDDYIIGLNMGTSADNSKSYASPFINGIRGILAVYDLQIWLPKLTLNK